MTFLRFFACMALALADAGAQETLPGTELLSWTGDLSTRMHEAAHHDLERMIAASIETRPGLWHRDASSPGAYERSIAENRAHFRKIIGLVDARVPVAMERFGDDANPALLAESAGCRIFQVRWPVLDGVTAEGLLLEPRTAPRAFVVALPDADETPEQFSGLEDSAGAPQFARQLAERGCVVLVPTLIDRQTAASGNPELVMTNEPHREWLHRQAYMMGRHLIGYEVQKVLAAVDWFEQRRKAEPALAAARIGVAGFGEGGLVAFYSAAVDARIDAALVSGYFKSRQQTWQEPLYRNVWGLLREFGDAEIATLIAPRGLVVEYRAEPNVSGPPPVANGQRDCAAPGKLETPPFAEIEAEFNRVNELTAPGFQPRRLVRSDDAAIADFSEMLHASPHAPESVRLADARRNFDPAARQFRQVKEIENHVQRLLRDSDRTRNDFFLHAILPDAKNEPWTVQGTFPIHDEAPFIAAAKGYAAKFWSEVIGKIETPLPPPNPRTRKIYDEPKWTGYEVVVDVGEEGFAWGVLCIPKNIAPGERRPVVVCQHGRNGLPFKTIEGDVPGYHDFAAHLAERGFITFAPHNLYKNEALYRMLSRKANTVQLSMFSFIVRHHEQWLRWLASLPQVDAQRIAFYGLSYGGETAIRVPPLLDGYALSICAGDFNDWTRKVASTHDARSFMFTNEWEMPYFNMGSTFSYAELSYLMFPRPFMVERGHHDGVALDSWVASEYAKTRWLYAQFGHADRTRIEFFNGGHAINAQGTFDFLHEQLHWPKPAQ